VFNIDSDTYTLGIAGFLQNGISVSTFSTIEGKVNSAQLVGRFAVSHAVAEPSSLMLLLLGLMGVFGLRRKSV
jgi:hypothetical protein